MNKRVTTLAIFIFFSIVSVVSAQRLVSLQPTRAIETRPTKQRDGEKS